MKREPRDPGWDHARHSRRPRELVHPILSLHLNVATYARRTVTVLSPVIEGKALYFFSLFFFFSFSLLLFSGEMERCVNARDPVPLFRGLLFHGNVCGAVRDWTLLALVPDAIRGIFYRLVSSAWWIELSIWHCSVREWNGTLREKVFARCVERVFGYW